jgi:hypothetical protein
MWRSNGPKRLHVCKTPIWAWRKRPGAIWECDVCLNRFEFLGRDIDGDAEFKLIGNALASREARLAPNYTPMQSPPGSVYNPETGKTK